MNVKTIYHSYLESCRSTGSQFEVIEYSTLNEHLKIENGTPLPPGLPKIGYICLGRGGYVNATAAGGESIQHVQMHKITSAIPFDLIPVAVRDIDNDFTAVERANYRLRKLETHNGAQKFVYYGLKVDITSSTPKIDKFTTVEGQTQTESFVPNANQLSVDPVSLDSGGQPIQSTGQHLSVYVPFTITLTKQQITDIIEAVTITRGSANLATINELCIVSGLDKDISNTMGGVSAAYKELLAAQVCNFIGVNKPLNQTNEELNFKLRLSDTQPLLV